MRGHSSGTDTYFLGISKAVLRGKFIVLNTFRKEMLPYMKRKEERNVVSRAKQTEMK
jgi:hypothetical protein